MWKNMFYFGKEMQSLYKIRRLFNYQDEKKKLNLNLDSVSFLTKWLLDFGYLDLNLDLADILTTMAIVFWIFGFEFGSCRYFNHNGYCILDIWI
jgi:hypothetical protein